MNELPKKIIIVGAGPSGVEAARVFQELAIKQNKSIEIVIIEKNDEVGGKCSTFVDNSGVVTELGATALVSNYVEVLKRMKEFNIELENILPISKHTLEINQFYKNLPFWEKGPFIHKLLNEVSQYNKDYQVYKKARESKTELPDEINKTCIDYLKSRNMIYLGMVLKPIFPGFNYGAIEDAHMDSIFEYLRDTTITEILIMENLLKKSPMSVVHGGFQPLIKKMAEPFDVRLSATITEIKREPNKVTVTYLKDNKQVVEEGNLLILANSPKDWPSLGLKLNKIERRCVNNLVSNKYPIAVCEIEGLPSEQIYITEGLEKNGFGKVNFLSSRDNRPEGGRIYTAYISTLPNQDVTLTPKELEKLFIDEISKIDGVKSVKVILTKVWDCYYPRLPWSLRLELDKQQSKDNTMYLGSYILGSFELVENVIKAAKHLISELYANVLTNEYGVDWCFFSQKRHEPFNSMVNSASTSTDKTLSPQ